MKHYIKNIKKIIIYLYKKYYKDAINYFQIFSGGTRYQWTNNQILLLLTLYKENQDELNQNKITHRKFWTIIVNGFKRQGYTITVTQCSTKIDTLKRKYKTIVDHNAQSGNDRKTCEFYDVSEIIIFTFNNYIFYFIIY